MGGGLTFGEDRGAVDISMTRCDVGRDNQVMKVWILWKVLCDENLIRHTRSVIFQRPYSHVCDVDSCTIWTRSRVQVRKVRELWNLGQDQAPGPREEDPPSRSGPGRCCKVQMRTCPLELKHHPDRHGGSGARGGHGTSSKIRHLALVERTTRGHGPGSESK